MARLRVAWLLVALASLAANAAAQQPSDDALSRAKTHFDAGRALYYLGNYTDAVREFAAGYQLAPRPQFLVNLGQCYLRMHELDKARDMYKQYLHDVDARDPERPQAQQILREIEKQLAERPAPSPSPPAPPPQPVTTAPTSPPPSPSPSAAPGSPSLAASPSLVAGPPAKKPFIKRHWWIIPVGAVVVGAAVGLGVYFGTRTDPCAGATLGCVTP